MTPMTMLARRLTLAATVVSGALLGVTGFRNGLGGQAMSGWWLWAHMALEARRVTTIQYE